MITLFSHKGGPNPWKVVIVLEYLGLKYDTKYLDVYKNEQKAPDFTKYNPNGRLPAIIDHDNEDFVLWESNSIIKYLVERYDKSFTLHYPHGTKESYLLDQWMTFQVSGQGPYFGQAAWFKRFHHEKLPSAIDRYQKEVVRVISVLDSVLGEKRYLVGDKLTVADLCFVPWNNSLPRITDDSPYAEELKKFTNFARWHADLVDQPAVKRMLTIREQATAA